MINNRLIELDGLRGLACFAIVLFHYTYRYNALYGHPFEISDHLWIASYGVHLFFMISGFVIYWTITKSERPRDFVWSRFSRLYPAYWVAINITFIAVIVFGLPGREVALIDFFVNFTMLQEYLGYKHIDGVYWTLSLELAFYFWMFIIFVLKQTDKIENWLIIWVLIASILTYKNTGVRIESKVKILFLLQYIEFFAAGIGFYLIKNNTANMKTYFLIILCIVAIFMEYSLKSAIGLLLFFILFWLVISNKAKILRWKPFVFLGSITYTLYLIHQNIGYVAINKYYALGYTGIGGIVIAIIISVFLSYLITYYIEKPSLKTMRNFYKKRVEIEPNKINGSV